MALLIVMNMGYQKDNHMNKGNCGKLKMKSYTREYIDSKGFQWCNKCKWKMDMCLILPKTNICDEEYNEVFMRKKIIYHGSNVAVPNPQILINGYYKDFGYGFYCTNLEKQAKRWALTKKGASIVNNYSYTKNKNLRSLCFDEMTEEWLDFVVNCRSGKEHEYDIVEGPMADDQIWDYVEDYIAGKISKAAFWELVKFKYPTHQIVFCTEAALSTLSFEGSMTL